MNYGPCKYLPGLSKCSHPNLVTWAGWGMQMDNGEVKCSGGWFHFQDIQPQLFICDWGFADETYADITKFPSGSCSEFQMGHLLPHRSASLGLTHWGIVFMKNSISILQIHGHGDV